ncbi:MAG: GAF domain-containing protein, partial [Elusimicrobia bacterium]|nr:GAF domain-containing protein [Elusimicrobiota bacterium]
IATVEPNQWGSYPTAGNFHFLFIVFATCLFLYEIYTEYNAKHKDEITSIQKQIIIYLILIYSVYALLFIFDNLFFYNIFSFEPIFYLTSIFFLTATTIIISSYNFSNIKIASIKILIFLFMLFLVLVLSNYILIYSTNIYISNFMTFMLAISFYMIYKKAISRAENFLFSQNKHYQTLLIHAASGMAKEHNIDRLLKLISMIVLKTVKVSFVAIFLENKDKENFEIRILRAYYHKNNELMFSYEYNHPFINFIKHKEDPFLFDEMPQFIARSVILPFRPALIIPSFYDGVKGFMVIGEKNNKDIFTKEDMSIFKMLARQTSLAMENCLFFDEYKQAQEKIFAAEKLASIGGLAEGVAHQIRNRLNEFSLISGELKFEVKGFEDSNEDLINKNKNLEETFDYITELSESLKNNITKTDEVIRGILDFAKMKAKHRMFETFIFKEIVDLAYEMLKVKHHLPNKLVISKDFKDTDKILGVKSQLIEVIYNIIDNAFEAIEEKYNLLKSDEQIKYIPEINISLTYKNNKAIIKITDNGIGIKEENTSKIFIPFFTTKSSSKSGTGIGMYIVKRMIVENHKGKIWFESKPMLGTDIIIELPNL